MFKPTKYQLFGIINLLICILPIYLLSESLTTLPVEISFQFFIHTYLPDIVLTLALIINLIIFYRIVIKKQSQDFKLNVIWTLFSFLWQLLMFFGYFFASDVRFPVISFSLVAFVFYFIQKISQKSAYAITVITIIVIIMTIMFGF